MNLVGAVQMWYGRLKPKSIKFFKELSTQFASHFHGVIVRREAKPLYSTKQRAKENHHIFIRRFHEEALLTEKLQDSTSLEAFKNNL